MSLVLNLNAGAGVRFAKRFKLQRRDICIAEESVFQEDDGVYGEGFDDGGVEPKLGLFFAEIVFVCGGCQSPRKLADLLWEDATF
ncbi:hypothetical protein CEXT_146071 [Caerostris extrusa]|uniref:Uncharacterized protein n=1 Tax=Caerostris extrusa TaxID=172846 RepID=A0AAV4PB15_CAEEX|nr:hypothetical protein CEXT_146071 [Caerostris extrusa]